MKKIQFWTLQILLVLSIIFIGTKVSFIFQPIAVFVSTLFFPILIAGFLFFILNPVVQLLVRQKIPKPVAIAFIYLMVIAIFVIFGATLGSQISNQIASLISDTPRMVEEFSESSFAKWLASQDFFSWADIEAKLTANVEQFSKNLFSGLSGVFSFVISMALLIVTVPFVLFYMLKDGEKLPDNIVRFVPSKFRDEARTILKETGNTLADYIQGQFVVCMFVGIACTVGYLIIGLKFALLFGILIGLLNIVPYAGPWIGAAPAVIVGFIESPMQAVFVAIVIIVVQLIDGNVISPQVIGNKLAVHPLTIVVILLVAGNLAGILGMILAVPTYAIGRLLVKNFYRIWKLRTTVID